MITYTTNIDDLTSERVFGLLNRLVQVFGETPSDYVIQWGGNDPTFLSVMTGQTSDLNALGATVGGYFAANPTPNPSVAKLTLVTVQRDTALIINERETTVLDRRLS